MIPSKNNQFKFSVIGCGGIGSYLAVPLAKYISFHKIFGGKSKLTLIDGDSFEFKNVNRQSFKASEIFTNKAQCISDQIADSLEISLNLDLEAIGTYVLPDNIEKTLSDDSVVFVCPDNARCRVLIEDWAIKTCKNIVVICAGNDYDDGQVQVMIIRDGKLITPPITKFYPEMRKVAEGEREVTEKPIATEGCNILATADPQLIFANFMAASIMLSMFYAIEKGTLDSLGVIFDVKVSGAFPTDFSDKESGDQFRAQLISSVQTTN